MTLASPTTATIAPPGSVPDPSVGAYRTPKHLYYFDGRGPWPGVTTVTDVLDKPALIYWKQEQVALNALKYAERLVADRDAGNTDAAVAFLLKSRNEGTTGRDRGSRIHNALESILRREPATIDSRDIGAIEGARAWLNSRRITPIEIETFLISEDVGYGGTCDLIAEIDGEVWLLDWKSSKTVANAQGKVFDEMRLQLAAYSHAEFIGRPGDSTKYPVPAITRYGILHVTDAGTKLYPADVTDDDYRAFLACLWLHSWRSKR